jgi:hypothetical protein
MQNGKWNLYSGIHSIVDEFDKSYLDCLNLPYTDLLIHYHILPILIKIIPISIFIFCTPEATDLANFIG